MSRISTSNLGIPGLSKKPVREVKEEDLLDDIEATTKRLYQQSRNINDESKTHIHLLTKVESDMTAESVALRAEAMRAETIRKGQSGVCWMYGIICMELVLLIFLLYIGISNQ